MSAGKLTADLKTRARDKTATPSRQKATAAKPAKGTEATQKLSAKALRSKDQTATPTSQAISKVGKPSSKPVVKSLAKKTTIAPSATKPGLAADKVTRDATVKTSNPVTKKLNSPTAKSGASNGDRTSNKPASAGLTDKFEKNVVSKASEVATKTTKPTSETILLTEAQILKMSEKDYMNEAQLAFFKARLQQLEKELLKNAGETTEHLRETVLVPDPADRATIEEEHALELRTRDRERKLLKKVQQSIATIDAGEYGWCEETGEPIGIPRLLARPTATLSLEAQQRRELKQKLYGD
ncbi:RNA polymerase-binding protein DksA [Paraherbaspirillum soli]|uniref:RNA polymerase-binding transcription factor DksA n=1 Tax=Paraherbaspirillum soli TaxID=631222 RepID=A0ABW0M4Y1_9BURK